MITKSNEFAARLRRLLGIESAPVSWLERAVSMLGGLLGIVAILSISGPLLHEPGGAVVVASMGASAVLLFAVPHGPLSQPWALVGGHTISAVIGVTCARFVPDLIPAAGLAVGLAILAMHITRSIHPPGGATALAAVVGGPQVAALGYEYVLTPVLLNVTVIFVVAIAFNFMFRWRRYPAGIMATRRKEPGRPQIEHEKLIEALGKLDTYMDISEQDLLKIYQLATEDEAGGIDDASQVVVGQCYSNGSFGSEWQVREVRDISATADGRQVVVYRVVAGANRNSTGRCGLMEFVRWAGYRVLRNENSWQRAD